MRIKIDIELTGLRALLALVISGVTAFAIVYLTLKDFSNPYTIIGGVVVTLILWLALLVIFAALFGGRKKPRLNAFFSEY